jgi:hypothetical protein
MQATAGSGGSCLQAVPFCGPVSRYQAADAVLVAFRMTFRKSDLPSCSAALLLTPVMSCGN